MWVFFRSKSADPGHIPPTMLFIIRVHGKLDMLAIYNWSIECHHPPLGGGTVGPPLKEKPLSFTNP
jgi:hypothetical protein